MREVIDAERIGEINNRVILAGFEHKALQYTDKSGKFLVVGHGKDIRFPLVLASEVCENGGSVVYQDLSPITKKVVRGTKIVIDDKKVKEWRHCREMMRHYGNMKIRRFPRPPFDIVLYFFEAHHIKNLEKSFKKAYDSLNPGGRIIVVDYNIKGLSEGHAILMFNSDRERGVSRPNISVEKEFKIHYENPKDDPRFGLPNGELREKDWYEVHTSRGLEDYARTLGRAGFISRYVDMQPRGINKLCLLVGEKGLFRGDLERRKR